MTWWQYMSFAPFFAVLVWHVSKPHPNEQYRTFRPWMYVWGGALIGLGLGGIAKFCLAWQAKPLWFCLVGILACTVTLLGGWVMAFRHGQNKKTVFQGNLWLTVLAVSLVLAQILLSSVFWPSQI